MMMMMMMNMKVCFLSSSSSSSSIKTSLNKFPCSFHSSRKSYSLPYHHQKISFNRCPNGDYNKGCIPFLLKCSDDGASASSLDDDDDPSMENADWRSFRSMLMATESATKPSPQEESSNLSGFVTKADHHTHINNKKRWAHILHRPETGCLLVATDKLNAVHIFERTAILILSMDHQRGPPIVGVILNRPLNETQSSVGDDDELGIKLDNPSFYGGPFDDKIFLIDPKKGGDELMMEKKSGRFEQVMEGFSYGRERGNVEEMVRKGGVGIENLRIFDGSVKWEKKKLEEEISDGYWKVIACSSTMMGLA